MTGQQLFDLKEKKKHNLLYFDLISNCLKKKILLIFDLKEKKKDKQR